MAINEDKIRNLIKDYEEYQKERLASRIISDTARAQVYAAVVDDLKELLPRQTLADIAGDNLEPYRGTWVECSGKKALVIMVTDGSILVTAPESGEVFWIGTNRVHPLDIDRVWDENGEIVH